MAADVQLTRTIVQGRIRSFPGGRPSIGAADRSEVVPSGSPSSSIPEVRAVEFRQLPLGELVDHDRIASLPVSPRIGRPLQQRELGTVEP